MTSTDQPPVDEGGRAAGAVAPPVLESAARSVAKATLVPLDVPVSDPGRALAKRGFVRQLGLRPGEVAAAGRLGRVSEDVLEVLSTYETEPGETAPPGAALAGVDVAELRAFGEALTTVRTSAAGARAARVTAAALAGLAANTARSPLGMLNLERLEMAPAGIERGELIATVPLAPLEETAVVEKEWSVQSKEFTSIVTDSLENVSETGVTDNTELSQSVTSQQQHSNQFNVTGTVSGGIPVISGSASSGFTSQSSESQSANDSRKHATELTRKASSRSKQEHKVTISVKSVSGREETVTRRLRNPSTTDPIRIDYFSLMRKWRVRLYRYGLRLTYDIVIPEPGAAMRRAHRELEQLRNRLGPFTFNVPHSDITEEVRAGETQPHYLVLADAYGAQNVPLPPRFHAPKTFRAHDGGLPNDRAVTSRTLDLPDGQEVVDVTIAGRMTRYKDKMGRFTIEGTTLPFEAFSSDEKAFDPGEVLKRDGDGGNFLEGVTGSPVVVFFWDEVSVQSIQLTVRLRPTAEAYAQWRSDVWNALYNAAQTRYFVEQQDIAARITALEDRLAGVDTLTLRREESDEVMKAVIRFIAGVSYAYMDDTTIGAFAAASEDTRYGIGFTANRLELTETQLAAVTAHENAVRFVNQAIEWESVVTFLYSYFWDTPDSWDFVRSVQHPDPTRQAFLRAGSARVVLTVRKGWETRWLRFAESGFTDYDHDPGEPYLTIAQEIAAYDDRHYPGIPPANPGADTHRPADAVVTRSTSTAGPSRHPVTLKVESVTGFRVGARVVIGAYAGPGTQETQTVTAVVGTDRIMVQRLDHAHDGSTVPFPVVLPGEKGTVIAEWYEYTPNSGTDIAVGSPLDGIA
ncbi:MULTISPECIES: hypothetical protein [unclassified Streptomyces]|uniref:hypothetical protein n=1 Tax=unclassified Streptomyces TaxID=2593676 RepID=UPI00095F4AC6|nr:hypothetical protein [Streptomyces sp. TSRI0107]OKJ75935.1 hypothetical protein AMK31_29980 [Streptomyces sp. TSRI0107]